LRRNHARCDKCHYTTVNADHFITFSVTRREQQEGQVWRDVSCAWMSARLKKSHECEHSTVASRAVVLCMNTCVDP
jgi:hypothetical protein